MKTKFLLTINLTLALLIGGGTTYAASNSSLWGDIDEPVVPIKQIEQQQKQLQEQQMLIDNQKTICEIFTAQPTLPNDTASAAKIQDAILRAYKVTLPDYRMFVANKDAANNLYVQYRGLYLKTYCAAAK
jgi:hypothetical protein